LPQEIPGASRLIETVETAPTDPTGAAQPGAKEASASETKPACTSAAPAGAISAPSLAPESELPVVITQAKKEMAAAQEPPMADPDPAAEAAEDNLPDPAVSMAPP